MAKKAKKGNGKAKATAKPGQAKQREPKPKAKPKREAPDLDALRERVFAARAKLDATSDEAKGLAVKAVDMMSEAGRQYREALAPYRDACRKAGVECEFEGGRTANVSPKVSFIVEKTEKGIRVAVKGKPGSDVNVGFVCPQIAGLDVPFSPGSGGHFDRLCDLFTPLLGVGGRQHARLALLL